MAVQLRKSVRSASYLTTQPTLFSPLQRSDLSIFQLSPGYSLIFFSQSSPPTEYLSTGWAILLASFSQPLHPVSFDWVGIPQYLSTEHHSVSRP